MGDRLSLSCLIVPRARAHDWDGDGWDSDTSSPPDCFDLDPEIHPNAPEDGVDDVDEDCDGSPLIRREFVSSMNALTSLEFTLGSGVTLLPPPPDDLAKFTVGPNATMSLNGVIPFMRGEFTVTLRVSAITLAPTCRVEVGSTSQALTGQDFSTTGTHTFAFPGVLPNDDVTTLRVYCATDAGPGALIFTGSDVGGFGWSSDGTTWHTSNGTGLDWTDAGELGVWEAYAVDEASLASQDVVTLTGVAWDATSGGLWWTNTLGLSSQSWTAGPETASGPVGASRLFDDCTDLDTIDGANDRAAGRARTS